MPQRRDNAGAVCNSGMGMLFLCIYVFYIISLRGVMNFFFMHNTWCMMHDAWCMMHDARCTMYHAIPMTHDRTHIVEVNQANWAWSFRQKLKWQDRQNDRDLNIMTTAARRAAAVKIPQSVIHDRWRACSIHPYMSTWEGNRKRKYLVGGQEKNLGGIDSLI